MIKVFIVEDHYMVIEGIRSLLLHEKDIELVGSASTAESCRAFLCRNMPDVILMDINLPDASGIDLAGELLSAYPGLYILGLSTFSQESFIRKMMDNGASGYILKNASQKELTDAIREVARGKTYFAFDVVKTLNASRKEPQVELVIGRREKEVLGMLTKGLTTGEIAQQLFISTNTVDTYRKSLLAKLKAKNTAELIKFAFLYKVIPLE